MVLILRISSCLLVSNACSLATIERLPLARVAELYTHAPAVTPLLATEDKRNSHIRQFTKLSKGAC